MSQGNPFTQQQDPPQPNSTAIVGGNRIGLAVAIIGILGLMCAGLFSAVYFAAKKVARAEVVTELPVRAGESFSTDSAAFNRSLANPPADPCANAEICDFVADAMKKGRDGEAVLFNREMFIEAVSNSPYLQSQLGLFERLSLKQWMQVYEPAPDDLDTYHRILSITRESELLAKIELIVYSEENQAESQQWFLVNHNGNWKVYDWQNLEEGRRVSDEYATYLRSSSESQSGYDKAMETMAHAQELIDGGNIEQGEQLLRDCEQFKMPDEDRPVALLHLAYVWISLGKYEQAKRPLELIESPDRMWGVWPVLTLCHLRTDDPQAALLTVQNTVAQTPNHPRTHWLLSEVYSALERDEEAAEEAMLALEGCPKDASLLDAVIGYRRQPDVPRIITVVSQDLDNTQRWIQLVDSAAYHTDWAHTIVAELEQFPDAPKGLLELAKGNLEWARDDFDEAAIHFQLASDHATDSEIREIAENDHVNSRLENRRYDKLFQETTDLDATLDTLVRWAFLDDYSLDSSSLIDALTNFESDKQAPDSRHWIDAIKGWAMRDLGQHEAAAPKLATFLSWLEENVDESDSLRSGLQSVTEWMLVDSLTLSKKSVNTVARFPQELRLHYRTGEILVEQGDRPTIKSFLDGTEGNATDSVRLQRLRLQAKLAAKDGQVRQADDLHAEALKLAQKLDEVESYRWGSNLIAQRASDLVINRALPSEVNSSLESMPKADRESIFLSVVDQASSLRDSKTLRAWFQRAKSDETFAPESLNTIRMSLADYRFSQGEYSEAVDVLEQSLETPSDDIDYEEQERRSLLVQALLEQRLFEEAKETVASIEEPEDAGSSFMPEQTIVDLAAWNLEPLRKQLSKVESEVAGQWLRHPARRRWLERQAGRPEFDSFIAEFPIRIGYHPAESSGTIWFKPSRDHQNRKRNPELLAISLAASFGEPFDFETIDSEKDEQAWIATSETGNRILIGTSATQYRLEKCLAIGNQQLIPLRIAVLDQQPKADERLFLAASALATDLAVAFIWNDRPCSWFRGQTDLSETLAWDDRVPVNAESIPAGFGFREIKTHEPVRPLRIDQWENRLKQASGNIAVTASITCNATTELIECELEAVVNDEYDLRVRLKNSSKISPLARAGVQYLVSPSSVRLGPLTK